MYYNDPVEETLAERGITLTPNSLFDYIDSVKSLGNGQPYQDLKDRANAELEQLVQEHELANDKVLTEVPESVKNALVRVADNYLEDTNARAADELKENDMDL